MEISLGFRMDGELDEPIRSGIRDKKSGELTKLGKDILGDIKEMGIKYVKEHKGKITVLTVHKSVIDGFGKELTEMLRDVFGDEFNLEIDKRTKESKCSKR